MKILARGIIALLVCTLWVSSTLAASACSIQTSAGKTVDLSTIDVSNTGYTVAGTDPQWSFYFNICGAVTNPSTATCTTESQGYQYSKSYNLCYSLGQKGNPKVSFLNPADETAGVKVVHSGIASPDGVTRQLAISLTCDAAAADRPTLTFSGESREGGVISYGFAGKTKTACPGAAPPAPGPGDDGDLPLGQYGIGGLLLTLALVGLILYFIIGFVVLKFKMQKTGTEAIPQFAFWKDLPFLFIDGVMLPVDLIKGAMGKKNYQEMA